MRVSSKRVTAETYLNCGSPSDMSVSRLLFACCLLPGPAAISSLSGNYKPANALFPIVM